MTGVSIGRCSRRHCPPPEVIEHGIVFAFLSDITHTIENKPVEVRRTICDAVRIAKRADRSFRAGLTAAARMQHHEKRTAGIVAVGGLCKSETVFLRGIVPAPVRVVRVVEPEDVVPADALAADRFAWHVGVGHVVRLNGFNAKRLARPIATCVRSLWFTLGNRLKLAARQVDRLDIGFVCYPKGKSVPIPPRRE